MHKGPIALLPSFIRVSIAPRHLYSLFEGIVKHLDI